MYVKFLILGHNPGRQKILGPAAARVPGSISTFVPHRVFCNVLSSFARRRCASPSLNSIESVVVNGNENYEFRQVISSNLLLLASSQISGIIYVLPWNRETKLHTRFDMERKPTNTYKHWRVPYTTNTASLLLLVHVAATLVVILRDVT